MTRSRGIPRALAALLVAWLCVSCATPAPAPPLLPPPPPPKPYEPAAVDPVLQKAVLLGDVALQCSLSCDVNKPPPRFREMIERRDWRSLGLETARYNVRSDVTYYYLAQAALEQNAPTAAMRYARLAQQAHGLGERCSSCDAVTRVLPIAIEALLDEAARRPRRTILVEDAQCIAEQEPEQIARCKWSLRPLRGSSKPR